MQNYIAVVSYQNSMRRVTETRFENNKNSVKQLVVGWLRRRNRDHMIT